MALKMGLKGILILDFYDILLQIATRTVDREQNTNEQSMNASWVADSTRGFLKK
jgi:hypothetical protein